MSVTYIGTAPVNTSTASLAAYNQSAGHTIIVIANGYLHPSNACNDTAGNSYNKVFGSDVGSQNMHTNFWVCYNCIGNAANVITVGFVTPADTFGAIFGYDVTGLAGSADAQVSGTPTVTTPTSSLAGITTTSPNELIFFACAEAIGYQGFSLPTIGGLSMSLDGVGGQGGTECSVASLTLSGLLSNVSAVITLTTSSANTINLVVVSFPLLSLGSLPSLSIRPNYGSGGMRAFTSFR